MHINMKYKQLLLENYNINYKKKRNERVYLQHNLLIKITITHFGNNRIWNDKNYNVEFVSK